MLKNIGISALVALVVAGGVAFYAISTIPQPLGASSGTSHTNLETFYGGVVFSQPASSTLRIGATHSAGCLVLGDSANATSSVYITATGATVSATTTRPPACLSQ